MKCTHLKYMLTIYKLWNIQPSHLFMNTITNPYFPVVL